MGADARVTGWCVCWHLPQASAKGGSSWDCPGCPLWLDGQTHVHASQCVQGASREERNRFARGRLYAPGLCLMGVPGPFA